jgi:hypothetical protein
MDVVDYSGWRRENEQSNFKLPSNLARIEAKIMKLLLHHRDRSTEKFLVRWWAESAPLIGIGSRYLKI